MKFRIKQYKYNDCGDIYFMYTPQVKLGILSSWLNIYPTPTDGADASNSCEYSYKTKKEAVNLIEKYKFQKREIKIIVSYQKVQ